MEPQALADQRQLAVPEATVSAEFRRLWRAHRGSTHAVPGTGQIHDPTASVAAKEIDWKNIALRQDGARPLRFRGLPLYQSELPGDQQGASPATKMSFYVADDRKIFVSGVTAATEEIDARPRYRAAAIKSSEDFSDFLRGC